MVDTENFEDFYNNAPCGHLSVSPDGRILNANPTIARWLGRSGDAMTGMRLSDLMSIGARIYWETHLGPLLRMQGAVEGVALDLVASDGRKILVFASAVERHDDYGNLAVTRIATFRGADRRQYERTLVDARQAAEQANDVLQAHDDQTQETLRLERVDAELREQFIAVLGHDLRNPLSAIGGGVYLLRKETLSSKGAQLLGLMEASVTRMAGLIDNVLDFARGRLGGGLGLERDAEEPLDPVLLHVVQELRTSAPDRLIETAITISEPVNCDRSRVAQLVSNLLGNAITHGSSEQPIRVCANTSDGVLEISVINGGKPIPAVVMERLFQPFFRAGVRASLQGLGLGLYIASEIAKAHGGSLAVTSSDAETRFTFLMPL
jgi:sigma-B regulation protein RsbU (phosphoserine phosphatase)